MSDPASVPSPARQAVRPIRGMGRWSLVALGVNSVIGAGIYGLPGAVAESLGAYSIPAYFAAAAMVLIFGHSMALLARRTELTGGPYVYVAAAFGPFAGFVVGWLFFLARITALGAVTNVFVSYFARFVPQAGSGAGRALAMIGCTAVLASINIVGIRETARTNNLFAVGKMVPLAVFIIAGAFFADWSRLAPAFVPQPAAWGEALLLLIFAFGGFEFLTVPAEESTRPTEQVPFALIATITCVSVIYIGIQVVTVGLGDWTAGAADPLAQAAGRFAGAAGAAFMAAGAIVSTTGTNLANILVNSRLLYAFSRDGLIPAPLGAIHARYRTPVVAIAVVSAAGTALALSGTFAYLAALSAAVRLMMYGCCCAAALRLRPGRSGLASFALPAAGVLASVLLLATLSLRELVIAGAAAGVGVVLHGAARRRRGTNR